LVPGARILRDNLPGELLSPGEVDYVLRRAAEMDSTPSHGSASPPSTTAAPGSETSLSASEVLRLGVEAGLGFEALASALTEVRHRAMAEVETGPLARVLGSSRIIVSRVIPASAESVGRAVESFMRDQLLTIRRHHGDRIEWERAQGIWPGLLRSLDFSKRYGFSLVNHVETTLLAEGEHTAVTFTIDVSEMRRDRLAVMGLRSGVAFALFGLGGAMLFPGFGLADALSLASAGVACLRSSLGPAAPRKAEERG
jgi:hypothetical protein